MEDYGIEYVTSGHYHCTKAFEIQAHCPLHTGKPDYDLGLNPNNWHCWVHGREHTLEQLVQAFTGCSGHSVKELVRRYRGDNKSGVQRKPGRLVPKAQQLVKPMTGKLNKKHVNYLNNRGFNVGALNNKYQLESVLPFGDYGDRIYIPVIMNGNTVSFTTRSMNSEPKYKHAEDNHSVVPIKHTIYNIDNCYHSHVVIVEGVTDTWRLGDNAVALYGKSLSEKQLVFLVKRFKYIFVCMDPEAQDSCEKIVQRIKPYRACYKLLIADKDPGDFSMREVQSLWNHVQQKLKQLANVL